MEITRKKLFFYIQLSDIGEIHLGLRTLELMEAGVKGVSMERADREEIMTNGESLSIPHSSSRDL